jgi:hypothetical protein
VTAWDAMDCVTFGYWCRQRRASQGRKATLKASATASATIARCIGRALNTFGGGSAIFAPVGETPAAEASALFWTWTRSQEAVGCGQSDKRRASHPLPLPRRNPKVLAGCASMRHKLRWSSRMTFMTLRLRTWTSPIVPVLRAAVFRPVPRLWRASGPGPESGCEGRPITLVETWASQMFSRAVGWVMCQIALSSACRHDG